MQILEREMNRRFDRLDRQAVALQDGMRGLRKTVKGLFDYVKFLGEDLSAHKRDKTSHFIPRR